MQVQPQHLSVWHQQLCVPMPGYLLLSRRAGVRLPMDLRHVCPLLHLHPDDPHHIPHRHREVQVS